MARLRRSVLPRLPGIARRSSARRRFALGVHGCEDWLREIIRNLVKQLRKDESKGEGEMRGSGVAGVRRTDCFSPAAAAGWRGRVWVA